ncbi:MAG TPA: hypothetical protein VHE61_21625 [Opitutaceae bacterium]|nr:hypothetical protein [Opitutaceae bacterium]
MKAIGWRGWLVALAIFVLGAGVGVTSTVMVGKRMLRHLLQAPVDARGPADRAAARAAADLTTELGLTPEQSQRVQQILEDSARSLKTIRRQAVIEAARELRASSARIAAELPPEKRAGFYRVIGQRFRRLGLAPSPEQPPPKSP